jgi:hypothetical protein
MRIIGLNKSAQKIQLWVDRSGTTPDEMRYPSAAKVGALQQFQLLLLLTIEE